MNSATIDRLNRPATPDGRPRRQLWWAGINVMVLGILGLVHWSRAPRAAAGTPPLAALDLLKQVRDHYQSLSSLSMSIEHENSSGLYPGQYRQTLQWRYGGQFALVTVKPTDRQVPDFHADGRQVVWQFPDGRRLIGKPNPEQNDMPGWEVSGGPILSWLQATLIGKLYSEPGMVWGFGSRTRWHGLEVRELSGASRDRPGPGFSFFIDEDRKLLLGFENRSQGEPGHPGWAIYQDQKLSPTRAFTRGELRAIDAGKLRIGAAIDRLNGVSAAWMEGMQRAAWQGGVVLLLVWLGCWARPSLPAGVRCWLWRLAYLKLLVAFFWHLPVLVKLLPVPPALPAAAVIHAAPVAVEAAPTRWTRPVDPPPPPAPSVPLPDGRVGWLALWLGGIGVCLARMRAEVREVQSLYRDSQPLAATDLSSTLTLLCDRLGLRRAPQVRTVPGNACPSLLGLRRPVILLPETLLSDCDPRELEMVLAHELAHLKRRDLAWGWLAVAVRSLFFFHPMAWLAAREWQVAQESACDELAIRLTCVPPVDYGALLVSVAARHAVRARERWVSVGVLETYQTLTRRLSAVKAFRERSPRQRVAAGALLASLGILVLIPWRVVAYKSPRGTLLRQMSTPFTIVRAVAFSPDGRLLAGTGAEPPVGAMVHYAVLLDPETGWLERALTSPGTGQYQVFDLAFAPDGRTLAVGGGLFRKPGEVTLWDARTGELKGTLTGHRSSVFSLGFSPDGNYLASGSDDGTVNLWDIQSHKLIHTLAMENGLVQSVSFSPDGKMLAGACLISNVVSEVKLWEVPGMTLRWRFKEPKTTVGSVAFSPDGTQLAVACTQGERGEHRGNVRLWDPKNGELRRTLPQQEGRVLRAAFSPDGRLLASIAATADRNEAVTGGEVALWDAPSGTLIWHATATGIGSGPLSLAFSPDSQKLAAGWFDNMVRLWQVE